MQFNNPSPADSAMTLSQLNDSVRLAVKASLPGTYWLRAEISDVRITASTGHCYLEFVEKDDAGGNIVAKARGTVWAQTFRTLKPFFEQATGQPFASGLKVLVNVSVDFHKLYGYSLNVTVIDPAYTLGDLFRRRQQIIKRLQDEGVFDLNREIPFPLLPQRIAVITSPTAAGYGDFIDQLTHNPSGYAFAIKLFAATMQGEKSGESIIAALDSVWQRAELFDAVAIIRGGGSASDLSCFDSYELALHCTQFPLPILTGIGHERDDSIVDMVAHTRMKTPTAVAAFLIERVDAQATLLGELQTAIFNAVAATAARHRAVIDGALVRVPALLARLVERERGKLASFSSPDGAFGRYVARQRNAVDSLKMRAISAANAFIAKNRTELEMAGQLMQMASPEAIIRRGYTLTLRDGKIVKRASALAHGDAVTLRFIDGDAHATVESTALRQAEIQHTDQQSESENE
jgi:exodeoxyribonuclease VII large subunit